MPRKAGKHPKRLVACTGCAACCTVLFVPINDDDVRRLIKVTGRPIREIIRFYTPDDVAWPRSSGDWPKLRQGYRLMGLRKVRGRCVFLNREDRCSIYRDRPNACRTYPVCFDCGESGPEVDNKDAKDGFAECGAVLLAKPMSVPSFKRAAIALCKADGEYRAKVKRWKKTHKNGTIGEYLDYLGLS